MSKREREVTYAKVYNLGTSSFNECNIIQRLSLRIANRYLFCRKGITGKARGERLMCFVNIGLFVCTTNIIFAR